jgi:hypothetical protein
VHLERAFEFESDDLSLASTQEEQPDDLAVAINTDLPVHTSLVGQRAAHAHAAPSYISVPSLAARTSKI